MNPILMANMTAIMSRKPPTPKAERGVRLHEKSKSKAIILYLLENGKTSGKQVMQDLKLPNSPKAYIQPHLRAGRVICQAVHIHRAMYHIAEGLGRADFGMKGD
jgi:hypothetical protein